MNQQLQRIEQLLVILIEEVHEGVVQYDEHGNMKVYDPEGKELKLKDSGELAK
jgi:hypothetical protein